MGWNMLLVGTTEELPLTEARRGEVRIKLCCFVSWMRLAIPPLAAGTIAAYVGHVRSRHTRWLAGLHFNAVIGATRQVSQMLRAIRKERPAMKKKKVAFTVAMLRELFGANKHLIVAFGAGSFSYTRDFLVMAVALFMLCRLSEVTNTDPRSQANAFPILYSDLHFFTASHEEIEVQPSGRLSEEDWLECDYIRCRYPPSKSDPFSFNSDLYIPSSNSDENKVSAFEAIRIMMVCYPVRSERRKSTPLFRASLEVEPEQVRDALFMSGFRKMFPRRWHERSSKRKR